MARALIVGCGCHARELGRALTEDGWQVRGTSRTEAGRTAIAAAGLEAAAADPDRVGTVLELVGDVAVVVWLLGSASGAPDELDALQGSRLERLLEHLVDTPVRGFVYEACGTAGEARLAAGAGLVASASRVWRIPSRTIDVPRADGGWLGAAADAVRGALA